MTISRTNGSVQFVVFAINQQLYSLSIEEVVEILRVPIITIFPELTK